MGKCHSGRGAIDGRVPQRAGCHRWACARALAVSAWEPPLEKRCPNKTSARARVADTEWAPPLETRCPNETSARARVAPQTPKRCCHSNGEIVPYETRDLMKRSQTMKSMMKRRDSPLPNVGASMKLHNVVSIRRTNDRDDDLLLSLRTVDVVV